MSIQESITTSEMLCRLDSRIRNNRYFQKNIEPAFINLGSEQGNYAISDSPVGYMFESKKSNHAKDNQKIRSFHSIVASNGDDVTDRDMSESMKAHHFIIRDSVREEHKKNSGIYLQKDRAETTDFFLNNNGHVSITSRKVAKLSHIDKKVVRKTIRLQNTERRVHNEYGDLIFISVTEYPEDHDIRQRNIDDELDDVLVINPSLRPLRTISASFIDGIALYKVDNWKYNQVSYFAGYANEKGIYCPEYSIPEDVYKEYTPVKTEDVIDYEPLKSDLASTAYIVSEQPTIKRISKVFATNLAAPLTRKS